MQKVNQTYKIAPADRLASVSEYYFSKKLKEVAQMNAEGKDVISLGIGSPDMPPSEKTIETLCNNAHDPNGHGYQPYVGIPELRKGFAAWYQRWYGVEGRNPPCHTGFRQSRRTGIGTEPGISHLYFFEQDTRRGSYQLRPERGRWLDARFRNSGEYGFGPRKVDVDQLPEYADRRKRHSGTV